MKHVNILWWSSTTLHLPAGAKLQNIIICIYVNADSCCSLVICVTARSEPDGTRWRMGGEVKGKQANGVGSQYSHATFERGLSSITPRLPAVDWTDAPTALNGLVRFGERRTLVSARVPSRSARAIICGHDNNPEVSTANVTDQRLCCNNTLLINFKAYVPQSNISPKD